MNKLSTLLLLFFIVLSSCKLDNRDDTDVKETELEEMDIANEEEVVTEDYKSIGQEVSTDEALELPGIQERYANLQPGDTINLTFKSTVNEVCKKKGCWMKLEHGEQDDIMVKMKDYAFFMPEDIENKEVIVSGKAYISELSVEEQKHFAEDGGKSKEEIAQITEPKRTFSFMADGVAIPQ